MEKLDLQAETNLLLAKQIANNSCSSLEFINWALLLMEHGYYSDNLCILAGLDYDNLWDIDIYFRKVIDDFNLNTNVEKKDLLDFYLIYNIKKAIDNTEMLDNTVYLLSGIIYSTSYYLDKHLDFLLLYDELEELTGKSRYEYAIKEFKAFITKLESQK